MESHMGQGQSSWFPIWSFEDAQPWVGVGVMVLELAVIGVLAGITLGLRYKVLVLVPAVAVAMLFAVAIGVTHADRYWSIILAMVILGTAVQFGYLVGIVLHAAIRSICALTMGGGNPEISSEAKRI
jgi:hypothetical protein